MASEKDISVKIFGSGDESFEKLYLDFIAEKTISYTAFKSTLFGIEHYNDVDVQRSAAVNRAAADLGADVALLVSGYCRNMLRSDGSVVKMRISIFMTQTRLEGIEAYRFYKVKN